MPCEETKRRMTTTIRSARRITSVVLIGLVVALLGACSNTGVREPSASSATRKPSLGKPGATVRVQRGDGVAALKQAAPASVDLVLIDPPFDGDLFVPALQAAAKAVAAQGFIYLEAPRAWTDDELASSGLAVYRHLKAGAVHAHLLRPVVATAE